MTRQWGDDDARTAASGQQRHGNGESGAADRSWAGAGKDWK
ncbi:hypothetical protein [Candidatus Amarolinea dominans]